MSNDLATSIAITICLALLSGAVSYVFGRRSSRANDRQQRRAAIYNGPLDHLRATLREDGPPGSDVSSVWIAQNERAVEQVYRSTVTIGRRDEELAKAIVDQVHAEDAEHRRVDIDAAIEELDGYLWKCQRSHWR